MKVLNILIVPHPSISTWRSWTSGGRANLVYLIVPLSVSQRKVLLTTLVSGLMALWAFLVVAQKRRRMLGWNYHN